MHQVYRKMAVSERRTCQVLDQSLATQRREMSPPSDEKQLTNDIIDLAAKYRRYRLEFTARTLRKWLNQLGVKTLFIEPGSPWENGYIESFNGKMRDELLNREIFTTLAEAKVLIGEWRKEYNQIRPHSSLKYRPPAPEAILAATTR